MAENFQSNHKVDDYILNHPEDRTQGDNRGAWLDDAYGKTTQYIKEHPVKSAAFAAAAVGGLWYVTRGPGGALTQAVKGELAAGGEQATARGAVTAAEEFKAGAGNLKTFEGAPIPDLQRAEIAKGALSAGDEAFKASVIKAREGYAADLIRLHALPQTAIGQAGESGLSLAERLVKDRAAITNERVTGDLVNKELTRLSNLNGGQILADTDVSGRTLQVWNKEAFMKAAGDLQFKHVPPIGQFMKGTGNIGEQQIEQALQIQRGLPADHPRKLIGQILVDNKLAQQADVDLAFGRQTEMKKELKQALEQFATSN